MVFILPYTLYLGGTVVQWLALRMTVDFCGVYMFSHGFPPGSLAFPQDIQKNCESKLPIQIVSLPCQSF